MALIAVILFIGFFLLGISRWISSLDDNGHHVVYAEITSEFGVYTVYLDHEQIFSVTMIPHVVFEVRDGQIAFVKSDCPDQVCVRTGFLSRSGQMAACLPNKMLLYIQGS